MSNVKATVTVGEKSITFEGPRDFVDEQVAKYVSSSTLQVPPTKSDQTSAPASEREFVAIKRPGNHSETVAVLAYALKEAGQEHFSAEDIRRAYLRADIRPPKVIDQAIRDAKNNYDYVEQAGARGQYRLTHHGERTVRFDLPRND